MIETVVRTADYREQLEHWTSAFAVGRASIRIDDLDLNSSPDQVRDFVEGNVDKRRRKLFAWSELLDESFPDLDEWIDAYLREIPAAAYDSSRLDCGRFLLWVDTHCPLTAPQRDGVMSQRSRLAVEERARADRFAYLRFCDLCSVADVQLDELESNPTVRVLLNPTRVWGTLRTRQFLDRAALLPAQVMFYAADGDVRTAVLEGLGLETVRTLETQGVSTLDDLTEAMRDEARDDLREVVADLVQLRLAALA